MRTTGFLTVATIALTGSLVGMLPSTRAQAQEVEGHCTEFPGTKTTECTINRPIVTQGMTFYDGLFHPTIFEYYHPQRQVGIQLPGIGQPCPPPSRGTCLL